MDRPTRKQLEMMVFIDRFIKEFDNFPTLRDMSEAFGIQPNAVDSRINLLEKKGLVESAGPKKKRRTERFKEIISSMHKHAGGL